MAHSDHRLRIEGFRSGGDVCLRLAGHLSIADCEEAARAFEHALSLPAGPDAAERQAYLSLRDLEYIDSSGLALLIRLNAAALAAGSRLGLIAPSTKVAPVFKLTRMDTMLRIAEGDEAEALIARLERPEYSFELPAPRSIRAQAA